MPFAMSLRSVVLPAFGGETMSARWPFPSGFTRSMSRWERFALSVSRWNISSGKIGVRSSKRSEEHTSELQSRFDLVCRLLLEKKKKNNKDNIISHYFSDST